MPQFNYIAQFVYKTKRRTTNRQTNESKSKGNIRGMENFHYKRRGEMEQLTRVKNEPEALITEPQIKNQQLKTSPPLKEINNNNHRLMCCCSQSESQLQLVSSSSISNTDRSPEKRRKSCTEPDEARHWTWRERAYGRSMEELSELRRRAQLATSDSRRWRSVGKELRLISERFERRSREPGQMGQRSDGPQQSHRCFVESNGFQLMKLLIILYLSSARAYS